MTQHLDSFGVGDLTRARVMLLTAGWLTGASTPRTDAIVAASGRGSASGHDDASTNATAE